MCNRSTWWVSNREFSSYENSLVLKIKTAVMMSNLVEFSEEKLGILKQPGRGLMIVRIYGALMIILILCVIYILIVFNT